MTADALWKPLRAELDRWADAGRTADLWLRDDDAVAPTAPLDRLLALAAPAGIPVTLAVIPAFVKEALAARLASLRNVRVAVHGWSHANHAGAGEKKQELGRHRPDRTVLAELAMGLEKLRALHGERFVPLLVPPWNRIDPLLIPELGGLGFAALSVFGAPKPAPVPLVNATVDIMDWHRGRGCRPHAELIGEIVAQLRAAFASPAPPVGVLTHHLVHDESAWLFLDRLVRETDRTGCRWRAAMQLVGTASTPS